MGSIRSQIETNYSLHERSLSQHADASRKFTSIQGQMIQKPIKQTASDLVDGGDKDKGMRKGLNTLRE